MPATVVIRSTALLPGSWRSTSTFGYGRIPFATGLERCAAVVVALPEDDEVSCQPMRSDTSVPETVHRFGSPENTPPSDVVGGRALAFGSGLPGGAGVNDSSVPVPV